MWQNHMKICITLSNLIMLMLAKFGKKKAKMYVVVDATRNFLKKVAFAFGGSILNAIHELYETFINLMNLAEHGSPSIKVWNSQ